MSDEIPDDLIDMKRAARVAKCHLASMYRYVLSGKLKGWKRVGRWFVSEHQVRALFCRYKPAAELAAEKDKAKAKERAERNAFTEAMLKDMFGK